MSVLQLAFNMVKQVNLWLNFLALLILLTKIEAESLEVQRIGIKVDPKELPYQIFYDIANKSVNGLNWIPKCGGIILSKRAIVTTAHCLDTQL